jgi:hypothetical protein
MTEDIIFRRERALRGRESEDSDALNAFLASEEGQKAMATAPPGDWWEGAQDLAYQAWQAPPPRRYLMGRQPLVRTSAAATRG